MRFSIIIPVLDEAARLDHALSALTADIERFSDCEIIVCDGGSVDDTRRIARRHPVQLIDAPRGRARQMNAAAARALGDWLLFLHADTRLPADWMQALTACPAPWGRFDVRLSGRHPLLRLVEALMNLRSRLTGIATGDQVLFFRRAFFERIGGFPDIELMEDIAISTRARALSRPACLRQRVVTSSRRWEKQGILRTILLMWRLRLAYWLGSDPKRLHRLYYGPSTGQPAATVRPSARSRPGEDPSGR